MRSMKINNYVKIRGTLCAYIEPYERGVAGGIRYHIGPFRRETGI